MAEVESNNKSMLTEIEYDSPEEKDEIEFDSIDLQVDNLASEIQHRRNLALDPMVAPEFAGESLALPEIVKTHSKRLGLTDKQFARAAANQGLDLGVLVTEVGEKGNDPKDVFKKLENDGAVSFKPLTERKQGMKELRKKRMVTLRGQQINLLGQERVRLDEKEIELSAEELAGVRPQKEYNFAAIKDPSKRQLAVAEIVYEMGSDAGFSRDQMAAILANGFAESRLDPMAENPTNEDSHGVWQFNRGGTGEGVGFTVEQLQDPRFQMEQIIKAAKSRDELSGFRDSIADANELTKQFMIHFEKPRDQEESDIKKRQAYLGQANRLLDQAAKTSPKGRSLESLKRQKKSELLGKLQSAGKPDFKFLTDRDAKGGSVENEIAQAGSAARARQDKAVDRLINEKVADDPERARLMSQTLAKYSEDGADTLREMFADSAFQDIMIVGLDYDMAKAAKKLGMGLNDFKLKAGVEGSREHKIREYLRKVNTRHAALYITTGKIGVPALVSYEFMDPNNKLGEDRYGEGDAYWKRFFSEASRNRVQLVGLDDNDVPVFRAQNNFDSVTDKLNLHLSMSAGALNRLIRGPESESVVESLKEGSLEGIRSGRDFTKTLLSTQAARDSGWKALGLGAVGMTVDIFAPDPTFGAAKVASKTKAGVKAIKPIIKAKYVPATLDRMATAATDMVEAQKLLTKASEKFAEGDLNGGRALLAQAKKVVRVAEQAEKTVRKDMKPVMEVVDRTDSEIAREISRDVPLMMGKNTKPYEDSLGFSDFGMRRDYVHPSVERVAARGESEAQLVEYPEFFDISRKIDRLSDLSKKIEVDDVADAYVGEVQGTAMAELVNKFSNKLANRGFSRARSKAQKEEVTNAITEALDFMSSARGAKLLAEDPKAFEAALRPFVERLPAKKSKTGRTIMEEIFADVGIAHQKAKKIKAKRGAAVVQTDLNQQLVDVTRSVAAIAESRGAAHAFTRRALAEQEKVKIEPVIQSVTNRYEEIGTGKISATALDFRNELEAAFPAMRGDAAMHVARNLDDRLKAIHRRTGEDISMIYETRAFKDIIPALKRKASMKAQAASPEDAAKVVDDVVEETPGIVTDPQFSKLPEGKLFDDSDRMAGIEPIPLAEGGELLTSKEIRDFTLNLSDRLAREDMTDLVADLATQTVKQLKAEAKRIGLKGYSKLRKSDLIDAIVDRAREPGKVDELLRQNPELNQQYEALREGLRSAQIEYQKKLDAFEELKNAKAPTARDFLNQPSTVVETTLDRGKGVSSIEVEGTNFRLFDRDKAEMDVRAAKAVRDRSIAEIENFTRRITDEAKDQISLADDLDFIPGMIVKVEGNNLVVKSIQLPDELQGRGIATTLYKIAIQRAKEKGLGFSSDINPSPEAQRIYNRLIEERLPIKVVQSLEDAPGAAEARKTVDNLIDNFESEFGKFRIDLRDVLLARKDIEESDDLFLALSKPTVGLDEVDGRARLYWNWRGFAEELDVLDPNIATKSNRSGNDIELDPLYVEKTYGFSLDDAVLRMTRLRDELMDLDNAEFLARYSGVPVETKRYVIDPSDLQRLSDDVLTANVTTKAKPPKTIEDAAKPEDIANFVEDTQKTVRAMEEAPSVEEFALAINKVARRELDAKQMGAVVEWLASKGIKVGHRGAVFTADDRAAVVQAEEAFAKAFSDYAKGRPAPTTQSESAFERVKNSLLERFASAKNAAADGASFKPSTEIEKVFDDILIGSDPTESAAPNIFKALSRALLDDLPKNANQEFLMSIARESDRLGHPISVKEIKVLVNEAAKKYAKNPDADIRIELPGPIQLGGLLAPKPKSSFTMLEFARGAAAHASRKRMVDNPATRKIALDSEVNAIQELTPTQMIDQYVKTSRPLAQHARSIYLGADAIEDMRDLPPTVRKAIMSGVRITQQAIGDTVTLISEGAASGNKLVRFITGDPQIKFKSGRNALSAGHDMMGSSSAHLQDYIALFADPAGANTKHFNVLQTLFNRGRVGTKIAYDASLTQEMVKDAFDALVWNNSGSVLLQDIFKAQRLEPGQNIEPKHLDVLETIFHMTGNSSRKGKKFEGTSADQFTMLYKNLNKRYPVKDVVKDQPVANRVTCLLAGHGQAIAARLRWVDLGIAVDAKTATNFKKWIQGESIDDLEELQKVREVFQTQGYNPRFLEASDLDGLGFYVPKSARKKLSMALEQATDPDLKEFSGDMLEALGKGLKSTESTSELTAAWTMRYVKTRMVRGHFLLKSRYFFMNTMDHFNQMGQIVGFRPAFISTMRILPQTFAANPVFQSAIFGIQKAGKDEAGEVLRRALTSAGDAGADWAARLTRSSKWRGDRNQLLEARDGFLVVDGVPHAYRDLRRIGVEEGLAASFDTAELGTKIRRTGSLFLDDVQAAQRKDFRVPGVASYEEMVKIAEDIAEGWSERERFGAMLTLIEMGVEPRKAARLSIDALYDYAGSMSKADRHWLVNIFLPFWAFQKNANRQLIDVVFSPRGAYRLGVLNRAYERSTELTTQLLFEGMVDPLGVNTDGMTTEELDAYEALKASLAEEYGVPVSQMPDALKRQIRIAFSGRPSILENGRIYELDDLGRNLRDNPNYKKFRELFDGRVVPMASRAALADYDSTRNAILMPYALNEQNKIYFELANRTQATSGAFTAFLLPEQSYKAAANHIGHTTMALFQMGNLIREAGPAYFSDAEDGSELFQFLTPATKVVDPERGLFVSDALQALDINDGRPYRLHPLIAKQLDQMSIDVLPVDKKSDPIRRKLGYSEAVKQFNEGKIKTLTEDPFLLGETLEPVNNYYLAGGIGAMVMRNLPLGELNQLLLKYEKTPLEQQEGLRSEIQRWARLSGIVDVRDVQPKITARSARFGAKEEVSGKEFLQIKEADRTSFLDESKLEEFKDDPEIKQKKQSSTKSDANQQRLERLKKRDSGEMEIDI